MGHKFGFSYISTFRITNRILSEENILKIMESDDSVITRYNNEGRIEIKEGYSNKLDKMVKKMNDDLDNHLKESTMFFKAGFESNLAEDTLNQIRILSAREKDILGKMYLKFGLKPFYVIIEENLFPGTAIIEYLGQNVFSITLNIFSNQYKLSFDDAVYLLHSKFSDYEIHVTNITNNYSIRGPEGLHHVMGFYRKVLLSLFGDGVSIYKTKIYEILSCYDFWPSSEKDIFYCLNQPTDRERISNIRDDHLMEVMKESDICNYNDHKVYANKNRIIMCFQPVYEKMTLKETNMASLELAIYDAQNQYIIPLKRVMGSYCLVDNIRHIFEHQQNISLKELNSLKTNLKVGLKIFLLNENYKYGTVTNLIVKLRSIVEFDSLLTIINEFISSADQILSKIHAEKIEKANYILGGFLGLFSIMMGLNTIESWVGILKKIGIRYAVNHPLRLTFIFLTILILINGYLIVKLITNKNISLNSDAYFKIDSASTIKDDVYFIDNKKRDKSKSYALFRRKK